MKVKFEEVSQKKKLKKRVLENIGAIQGESITFLFF